MSFLRTMRFPYSSESTQLLAAKQQPKTSEDAQLVVSFPNRFQGMPNYMLVSLQYMCFQDTSRAQAFFCFNTEKGPWVVRRSSEIVSPSVHSVCQKMKNLKKNETLNEGFTSQIPVTVAVALFVDFTAPSNNVAVRVLHQLLTGTLGDTIGFDRIRSRGSTSMKFLSQKSVARRLMSPFFLPIATSSPPS